MHSPIIFREYDIRGVYEEQFDLEFAYQLGAAFALYTRNKTKISAPLLTVGYDARISSPDIHKALVHGMTDMGCHVYSLGLVTSPISYFSTFVIPEVVGGIMITGSHNPPDYNGFKVSFNKGSLFGEEIQKLSEIVSSVKSTEKAPTKGWNKDFDILTPYVEKLAKEFSDLKDFPVVFDCGNGAAGSVLGRLAKAIGLKATILFEQPDGRFPNHHPDPTVEKNLKDLVKSVKETKAPVGIGFDGDADRIGIVDENGKMIYGDELMALIANDVLQVLPGSKIIGDVKCSDRLYQDIQLKGGVPIMWKTGHSLIKEKIKIEKAPFGGEMSGHVFFADRNFGYDDAIYAGLRVLEILKKAQKPVSKLLQHLPPAFNTPEIRIDTTEEKKILIVSKLKEYFSNHTDSTLKVNLLDGIRVSYPNGWALARASNTQPVLVLRFESSSAEGMKNIESEFMNIVNKYL